MSAPHWPQKYRERWTSLDRCQQGKGQEMVHVIMAAIAGFTGRTVEECWADFYEWEYCTGLYTAAGADDEAPDDTLAA